MPGKRTVEAERNQIERAKKIREKILQKKKKNTATKIEDHDFKWQGTGPEKK